MKRENIKKGIDLLQKHTDLQDKQKMIKAIIKHLEKNDYDDFVILEFKLQLRNGREPIFLYDDDFDKYRINIIKTIDEKIQVIVNNLEQQIEEL